MTDLVPLTDLPHPSRSWDDPTVCRKCNGQGINAMAWFISQQKYRCKLCGGTGSMPVRVTTTAPTRRHQ